MTDKPQTTLFGYVLITVGLVPSVLWILDYIGIIRPNSDPLDWSVILVTVAFTGVGTLLIKNDADTLAGLFSSWFGKKG